MAYGRKNEVKIDPLAYNLCLLGESKIGKTTIIKEYCERLAGEDGYLFLECGQERGADAIQGINYINCPQWNMDYDDYSNSIGLADLVEDIVENKSTEYKNLRVVVIDTYDHLINMAEKESIRTWKQECIKNDNLEKFSDSINSAWGGFQKGENKAIELMFDKIQELNNVGVRTIVIGHIKIKDVTDAATGLNYRTLTSDQQQNYFGALKKNLHFLGLAYIDRTIVKEKTGKKNIVTKKEEIANKVTDEVRKIKFRDDNFAIDSGSRFSEIEAEIPFNVDALIDAITNAIKAEANKGNKTVEQLKKEQEKEEAQHIKKIAEKEVANKKQKEFEAIKKEVIDFIKSNIKNKEKITPIIALTKELGYDNPTQVENIEDITKLAKLIK